jgi:hypothetical protein
MMYEVENIAQLYIPDNTVEYNQCILTISPRNDLSTLSLSLSCCYSCCQNQAGTEKVRHSEQLFQRVAQCLAERLSHRSPSSSLSSDSPRYSPRALSLHWVTRHRKQIFQPAETLPTTLQELSSWAARHTLPANTYRRSNSTSRYPLSSDFPRALSLGGRYREQLFKRVLAERLSHRPNYLPSKSPSSHSPRDSPRALSRHWPAYHREQLYQRTPDNLLASISLRSRE